MYIKFGETIKRIGFIKPIPSEEKKILSKHIKMLKKGYYKEINGSLIPADFYQKAGKEEKALIYKFLHLHLAVARDNFSGLREVLCITRAVKEKGLGVLFDNAFHKRQGITQEILKTDGLKRDEIIKRELIRLFD